jgi:hypothetical protein
MTGMSRFEMASMVFMSTWQWGEWCPERFVKRLLSEVFTWPRGVVWWIG